MGTVKDLTQLSYLTMEKMKTVEADAKNLEKQAFETALAERGIKLNETIVRRVGTDRTGVLRLDDKHYPQFTLLFYNLRFYPIRPNGEIAKNSSTIDSNIKTWTSFIPKAVFKSDGAISGYTDENGNAISNPDVAALCILALANSYEPIK